MNHADGSSPRGRGTEGALERGDDGQRFIPAWAGHGSRRVITEAAKSVHPRVGGARLYQQARALREAGSSPRGRGTEEPHLRVDVEWRFIPAWAGHGCCTVSTVWL